MYFKTVVNEGIDWIYIAQRRD